MNDHQPIIQVEHLVKKYGELRAVDDISFQVERGEIFGIIGPNGAGKTTTVESIIGMRKLDSGKIRVLGMDPRGQANDLRQRIGVQLQQGALPEAMRVWEALDLFSSFYRHPVDWKPLLETWGLAEKRNTSFNRLSGGQQQRLFIALALVNQPEIVFLDELTTGLDPQARRNTWDLVRSIRDQGKTVVLVTHFIEEAEKLCDRVAIIDHGRLIALDAPKRLIREISTENRVRFTTSNGFNPSQLEKLPGITRAVREGNEVIVYGNQSLLLQVASALNDLGIIPGDLRTEQATLEDVFLARTGRKIRA